MAGTGQVGAVIMAAGAGRRMGCRPKALLQRDGETLLARQLRLLAQVGVHEMAVVLGHHAERIQAELERLRPGYAALRWTRNPVPDAGPGASLRCGLAVLPPLLDGVLVLLGDQPLLEPQDLELVLQAWQRRPAGIELVLPTHDGQAGHPIAFGPALRRAVMQASGGAGVREWRRAHPQQVRALALPHARCTTDIDTPADLERLGGEFGVVLDWPEGAGGA